MEATRFYIGDQLPLTYDVAMAITSVCPSPSKKGREIAIHKYGVELHKMWIKAFGLGHVVSLKSVKERIVHLMKDYDTKCYKACSKSRRDDITAKPLRILNKKWRFEAVPVKKNTPKTKIKVKTNNDLFDIGKDMETIKGAEKAYYDDQKTNRIFRLSEEIDEEFEEEVQMNLSIEEEKASILEFEQSFSDPPEFKESMPVIKDSKELGKKICMIDKEVQVEINVCPEIRKRRNTIPKVKDTIATVSYRAGISVSKARVATQTVCDKLYGHNYHLQKPNQTKLSTIDEEEEEEEPMNKKPQTAEDYKSYKYVLPSEKSINTYKHLKAMHQEIIAAESLMNKNGDTKVTLHYDTTSRSRLEGEWPGLILNFLSKDPEKCKMFNLRALRFALENRIQIKKLILETLARLSAAVNGEMSSKELWEKINAFMTDAVAKNLKVEHLVAEELQSNHIPYHILCKAHTCEKLDECNELTLMQLEQKIKLRDIFEKREPRLKSFIRKSKSVTKAAIVAFVTLVAKDCDGKSVSLADEFDVILEEDGVSKSYSMYKERRFTKMGYTSGAIFDCLPQFRKLLERTHTNNLLVRACRLYLECEFVMAALKALSFFTNQVTMPYLNAVEKCDQNELLKILPALCSDLKDGTIGKALEKYHVKWTHVSMENQQPTTAFDKYTIKKMCIDAGAGVEMQCAREYWSESDNPRATQLFKLTEEDRENLPTENLEPERYMYRVGYLAAQSAAHSNKFFKAKRMRDDLMFVKESERSTSEFTRLHLNVFKRLDEMETKWTEEQKQMYKDKIATSLNVGLRDQTIDMLLNKCKKHGGPVTNELELKNLIKNIKDEGQKTNSSAKDKKLLKTTLRTEMQYQKAVHVKDVQERPELYKVNCLTEDQLQANLLVLLTQEEDSDGENVLFHTEDEIMELLSPVDEIISTVDHEEYKMMDALALFWDDASGFRYWNIGFYIGKNSDGTLRIDNLVRTNNSYEIWKRGNVDDMQDAMSTQIIPVTVVGDWFFGNRYSHYIVENWNEIEMYFSQHFLTI